MTDEISQLHTLRLKIAAYSQTLAERELTGRLLGLEIEAQLRTDNAGLSPTAAEKLRRGDAQYIQHERRSIQLAYDKAVAEAEAEATKLRIEWATATADRVGIA